MSDNFKPGDLVSIPEIVNGDFVGDGPSWVSTQFMSSDGGWEDPGPLMVMKTAKTNEGKLLVQVHLLSELDEYDPDGHHDWDNANEYGYRLYKSESGRDHQRQLSLFTQVQS